MSASTIPLSHLGSRSFNHSQSQEAEREYDRLRDLARKEISRKQSLSHSAHEAYERGDGQEAHQLSEQAKEHGRKADQYNKQASEYIFRENNAQGRVAGDTIDLHGQFVEEAEDILEQRIRQAQSEGQTHLHVIVGKGNHSANHVQKLKPRVEQLCQELGLQYSTEENAGRIYVNLGGGPAEMPPQDQVGAPGYGHHGGHHGGHQGGQPGYPGAQPQQPHYGGGQQGQQDDGEDMVKKLLPKIFKALKGCCNVM